MPRHSDRSEAESVSQVVAGAHPNLFIINLPCRSTAMPAVRILLQHSHRSGNHVGLGDCHIYFELLKGPANISKNWLAEKLRGPSPRAKRVPLPRTSVSD